MADSFDDDVIEDAPSTAPRTGTGDDVEMGDGAAAETAAAEENANGGAGDLPFAESGPDDPPAPRVTFAQYLSTPTVTLLIGSGEAETLLTAHQGLLVQSPYFAEACAEFADDGSVCALSSVKGFGGFEGLVG